MWRSGLISAVVLVIAFGAVALAGSAFQIYVAGTIAVFGLAAVGQGWLMGWAGQVSLGGGALFGVGAFAAALTSTTRIGAPLPVSLLAAAVAGGVVGAIIAIPGLRFKGVYLLLATLALQYLVQFVGQRIQDAPKYVAGVPATATFGSRLVAAGRPILVTASVLLVVAVVVVDRLYRSQAGREWAAVKENELAASAMGIDVRRSKTWAFVGSSAVTGLAGGLYAYYIALVSYTAFDLNLTLQLVIMVFVGGSLIALGPVIGAAIITILPYVLNDTIGAAVGGDWYEKNGAFVNQIIYGAALALILLYARGGLTGLQIWLRSRLATLDQKRTHRAAPPGGTVTASTTVTSPVPRGATDLPLAAEGAPGHTLQVRDLRIRYRGSGVAVDGVSLHVAQGEIVALLGRNGAGKSSILKAIGGFPLHEHATVHGQVQVEGVDLLRRSPELRSARGVVLVPEQNKVFPTLTVAEHFAMVNASADEIERTLEATGLTMLAQRSATHAGSLSGGERQFLALAVAMLRRPKVLLVDEMTLGLAPIAVARVADALRQIREAVGCSVLFVEQNARVAIGIADRVAILDSGTISWTGLPGDTPESQLEASYFGSATVLGQEQPEGRVR